MGEKTVNLKEIPEDIENGFTDEDIMRRYDLNPNHLERVKERMVDAGYLTKDRTPVARPTHSRTCASCGASVSADLTECMHCGAEESGGFSDADHREYSSTRAAKKPSPLETLGRTVVGVLIHPQRFFSQAATLEMRWSYRCVAGSDVTFSNCG